IPASKHTVTQQRRFVIRDTSTTAPNTTQKPHKTTKPGNYFSHTLVVNGRLITHQERASLLEEVEKAADSDQPPAKGTAMAHGCGCAGKNPADQHSRPDGDQRSRSETVPGGWPMRISPRRTERKPIGFHFVETRITSQYDH
ncbi:hypothetical protein, partial [Actinomadura sp. 6N118]|uniref:hypothetical protein n=1 Tax=Actinomadura sp. 6N118 TaxID=3375151 RepID=UPI003790AD40